MGLSHNRTRAYSGHGLVPNITDQLTTGTGSWLGNGKWELVTTGTVSWLGTRNWELDPIRRKNVGRFVVARAPGVFSSVSPSSLQEVVLLWRMLLSLVAHAGRWSGFLDAV